MPSGMFRISSLTDGTQPASINPTRPALQKVYLGGPIIEWAVRRMDANVYSLSIGGYPHTSVVDGNLAATVFEEQDVDWLIERQEFQDAFTIASSSDPSIVWTVASSNGSPAAVSLKPLVSTASIPPRSQLWRLDPMWD
ncbi:hypothetical protein GFY24_31880 [Nocardia sp. SYP-A9097]|uniref:I66 family serine proteinase inhibitor n=1 Tax=Nocardia sp. SYP-A9097 TaxID=2663237 RepID=UPI00129B1702|nr:I66 family serine proteinase inhibitor [Nocardia sp. SYP-A9097]MRH91985.1 hypothetical protein [Nocardia sp. SYP-A9097]